MSIVFILILLVVSVSFWWAFKIGFFEAATKGYVFSFTVGTAEDGAKVPVLKLEQGWRARKFVAASPLDGYTPGQYGVSEEDVSRFLTSNKEGYGQRLVPLVKVTHQREQNMIKVSLFYDAEAAQKARDAYRQASEQVQNELKKVYRRIRDFPPYSVDGLVAEGIGSALQYARQHRDELDTTFTLSSVMHLAGAAWDLGLLSRSAYEDFLDSCEGMDKDKTVILDEDIRQVILKYVDDPKLERKLRRRQKRLGWVYPLDFRWFWDDSLNRRKGQEKD